MKLPRSQFDHRLGVVIALLGVLFAANSCGGGGSSSPPPPPPPPALQIVTDYNLPSGIANKPYSTTIAASGGSPPYAWSLAPGSQPLPAGFTLSTLGVLSGTPTEPNNSPYYCLFTLMVTDTASHQVVRNFQMVIVGTLRMITNALAPGNVGISYLQALSAYGGVPPYAFSVAANSPALPVGLTLNASGTLSGTPDTPGNFDIEFQVQDSSSIIQTATRVLNLSIMNNLVLTTTVMHFGVVGQPYNYRVAAVGGTPPYTFVFKGGNLVGLTLQPDGYVTGTPTTSAYSAFLVEVTDSASPPAIAHGTIGIEIRPALYFAQSVLYDGVRDAPYGSPVWVGGGTPPLALRIVSGTLPAGLRLDISDTTYGNFFIRGTPTATGSTDLTFEASDSSSPPVVLTRSYTLRINERLTITSPTLPAFLTGDPISATHAASGGIPPYQWSCGLPAGLTLDSATGVLSGIPTAPYDGSLTVVVSDSSYPNQSAFSYSHLTIVGRLQIATTSLPPLMVGVPVDIALATSGGAATKVWNTVSGSLPAGLMFNNSTGRITGTPTAAETTSITLRVDDAGPPVQSVTATLTVTTAAAIGRNDSIATATPLSNGTYLASLSPADDASGATNPDNDYYALTASPGSIISVEITADRLLPKPSPMDSVIEILDASGARYTTCSSSSTYGFYNSCMNDDISAGYTLDSKLYFQVPGTPGGAPVTFFVQVLDWSGMARPDFRYTITISGAN